MDKLIASLTSPTVGFLLKLLAGLAAAGFGILGIGTKTRDESHKLTRNGWIALIGIILAGVLAVSTSIYDFASGQRRARSEQRRSELLLTSVQRGIYPMRSVKASFTIRVNGKLEDTAAFKKTLHDAISKDRSCDNPAREFNCWGYDGEGKASIYRIPRESPLFPKEPSTVRRILENLYVYISLYKKSLNETKGTLTKLGRFFIDWRKGLPEQSSLYYDYKENSLSLTAEGYAVSDNAILESKVESLVDFIPGAVAACAFVLDDRLCDQLKLSDDCAQKILDPLIEGLSLQEIVFTFPYPKAISITKQPGNSCVSGNRKYITLELPYEVEALGSLENIERTSATDQSICQSLEL